MARRLDLHEELELLLGSTNVYFQPPENIKLNFPCIIYKCNTADSIHADNMLYLYNKSYTVTVIDSDPDSPLPDKLAQLPKCVFVRHYTTDHMNHDVFTIFY